MTVVHFFIIKICKYYLRVSWTLWVNINGCEVIRTTFVRNDARKIDNFLSGSIQESISGSIDILWYLWKISKCSVLPWCSIARTTTPTRSHDCVVKRRVRIKLLKYFIVHSCDKHKNLPEPDGPSVFAR